MANDEILIPEPEQIKQLRKLFLEKLDGEGAPSTCVGKLKKIIILLFVQ